MNIANQLYKLYRRIRNKYHYLITNYCYKFLSSGKGNIIISPILLTPESIEIGNNVFIRNNGRIEGVRKYQNINYSPRIIMEDNVSIEQNIHLTCAELIRIGANTAIASNVTITDINHPYTDIDTPIEKQILKVTPVLIGEDCKIYNNAVILPGTQIGKHCVVGANSIVSGVFPDYCIMAGSPARIIKKYSFDSKTWVKQ